MRVLAIDAPTYLITGGTGFIGSRLALCWARRGEAVRVYGLSNTPAERQNRELLEQEGGIDVVHGDVLDRPALEEAMDGIEVVIHLAAAQHEAGMPESYFHGINVEGTANVFDAAVAAGVRRVVHGSTIGVYRPDRLVTPDTPLKPSNSYGRTKLAAEHLIQQKYLDRIETVILRLSETYGLHDRRLLKMYRAIAKGRWYHFGGGRNPHHPIYVDDLAELFLAAAERDRAVGRTLVAAGADVVTSRQMADHIATVLRQPQPFRSVPIAPIRMAATLIEGVSRPLHVTPPLHRRRLDFFVRGFGFDTRPLVETLGVEPSTPFSRGAVLTAEWYGEHGLLQGVPHLSPVVGVAPSQSEPEPQTQLQSNARPPRPLQRSA